MNSFSIDPQTTALVLIDLQKGVVNRRAFEQIFAEDAMASFSASTHQFAIENIFPRMGRVRSTDNILQSM